MDSLGWCKLRFSCRLNFGITHHNTDQSVGTRDTSPLERKLQYFWWSWDPTGPVTSPENAFTCIKSYDAALILLT